MRTFLAVLFLMVGTLGNSMGSLAQACETKRYCKDMGSCAEAYHYYTQCGLTRLDRDKDGIPCEKACGKTIAQMNARIQAQPYNQPPGAMALLDKRYECGTKRYCREMLTCDEARHYLTVCNVSSLDGNNDGIPCNGLCKR